MSEQESIHDQPVISGCYLFPQRRYVNAPFRVQVTGAELACYRQVLDPTQLTVVHFQGNGEAVADYVPWMADELTTLGLNSLLVELEHNINLSCPGGGDSLVFGGAARCRASVSTPIDPTKGADCDTQQSDRRLKNHEPRMASNDAKPL